MLCFVTFTAQKIYVKIIKPLENNPKCGINIKVLTKLFAVINNTSHKKIVYAKIQTNVLICFEGLRFRFRDQFILIRLGS